MYVIVPIARTAVSDRDGVLDWDAVRVDEGFVTDSPGPHPPPFTEEVAREVLGDFLNASYPEPEMIQPTEVVADCYLVWELGLPGESFLFRPWVQVVLPSEGEPVSASEALEDRIMD